MWHLRIALVIPACCALTFGTLNTGHSPIQKPVFEQLSAKVLPDGPEDLPPDGPDDLLPDGAEDRYIAPPMPWMGHNIRKQKPNKRSHAFKHSYLHDEQKMHRGLKFNRRNPLKQIAIGPNTKGLLLSSSRQDSTARQSVTTSSSRPNSIGAQGTKSPGRLHFIDTTLVQSPGPCSSGYTNSCDTTSQSYDTTPSTATSGNVPPAGQGEQSLFAMAARQFTTAIATAARPYLERESDLKRRKREQAREGIINQLQANGDPLVNDDVVQLSTNSKDKDCIRRVMATGEHKHYKIQLQGQESQNLQQYLKKASAPQYELIGKILEIFKPVYNVGNLNYWLMETIHNIADKLDKSMEFRFYCEMDRHSEFTLSKVGDRYRVRFHGEISLDKEKFLNVSMWTDTISPEEPPAELRVYWKYCDQESSECRPDVLNQSVYSQATEFVV